MTSDADEDAPLPTWDPHDPHAEDALLDQLQLAPTILTRLGVPVPETMKAKPFLRRMHSYLTPTRRFRRL